MDYIRKKIWCGVNDKQQDKLVGQHVNAVGHKSWPLARYVLKWNGLITKIDNNVSFV